MYMQRGCTEGRYVYTRCVYTVDATAEPVQTHTHTRASYKIWPFILHFLLEHTHTHTHTQVTLTSARTTDESEVVEASHLVLEGGGGVAKLGSTVLIIPSRQNHLDPVVDVAQREDLERNGQRLVAAPVRRENGTHEVRRASSHQFPRVFGQNLREGPLASERLGTLGGRGRSGCTIFTRRRRHLCKYQLLRGRRKWHCYEVVLARCCRGRSATVVYTAPLCCGRQELKPQTPRKAKMIAPTEALQTGNHYVCEWLETRTDTVGETDRMRCLTWSLVGSLA